MQDRKIKPLALLRRLYDLSNDSIGPEMPVLCPHGQDWVKIGRPKLNGFFDHKIHPLFLDRCKEDPNPWPVRRLGMKTLAQKNCPPPFLKCSCFGEPLAVATVENPQLSSRLKPQDGPEVMNMIVGKWNLTPREKLPVEIKPH